LRAFKKSKFKKDVIIKKVLVGLICIHQLLMRGSIGFWKTTWM